MSVQAIEVEFKSNAAAAAAAAGGVTNVCVSFCDNQIQALWSLVEVTWLSVTA